MRCLCGRSRHNANGSPVKYLNVSCYILHPFHVLSKVVLFSLIWYLRDRAGVRNVRWGATHGAGKAPALAWGRARAHMDMHEARYVDRTARWRCVVCAQMRWYSASVAASVGSVEAAGTARKCSKKRRPIGTATAMASTPPTQRSGDGPAEEPSMGEEAAPWGPVLA